MSNIRKRVRETVCAQYGVKDTDFNDDCNFDERPFESDSLDKVELLMAIEEEFNIAIDDNIENSWATVQDVIDYMDRCDIYSAVMNNK